VSGSKADEEAAPERAEFLSSDASPSGIGIIVPPGEVYIDSFVGYKDYNYPKPEGEVGVTLYCGHRQVSTGGQEEIIQIGIQGREVGFEDLPVMNMAFVIDKSNTMQGWKMDWIKESFEIFIDRVRDTDRVALVVVDSKARVLIPSTQMSTEADREMFREAVEGITAGGGKDLALGLMGGYAEVLTSYDASYVNRVLFLTDGRGGTGELLDIARANREIGVGVTTIGIGTAFNLKLMRDLAHAGGGSSRFISGRDEMEKIFGSDLDRVVVPVARDLDMKLEFLEEVEIAGTWGYDNRVEGGSIYYQAPTLHHRDYETILVQVRIPSRGKTGEVELAKFSLTYRDMGGNVRSVGPYYLRVNFVDMEYPVTGFSDAMVLRSGTMLHFAQTLRRLGEIYYSEDVMGVEKVWEKQKDEPDLYEELTGPEIRDLIEYEYPNIKRMMDMTVGMKKELLDARRRLGEEGFEEQIGILNNYIKILGQDLKLEYQEKIEYAREEEIKPPVEGRSLNEHLASLIREMSLDLREKGEGVLVVTGFTGVEEKSSGLAELINGMAEVEFSGLENMELLEKSVLESALEEKMLSFNDLTDAAEAVSVGAGASVDYIVTGSVVEMGGSVVIFGRIINIETEQIESAAQVIVSRGKEVEGLL
jgi:Ca-activated chloride channel family protein